MRVFFVGKSNFYYYIIANDIETECSDLKAQG